MALSKAQKTAVLVAIPVIFFLLPAPEGLSLIAWRLLGIYIATIVGLVIKPFGEPVLLLAAVAASEPNTFRLPIWYNVVNLYRIYA